MSTSTSGRRIPGPELPSGDIAVEPPPASPDLEPAGDLLTTVVPVLGSVGSVVVMATMGSAGSTGQLRTMAAAGLFLVATIGFAAAQADRQRTRRIRAVAGARASYFRHLASVRRAAREAGEQQRHALLWQHPPVSALPSLAAEGSRVWERGPHDPDFLLVRYGTTALPLARRLAVPERAGDDPDPASADALHRLVAVHTLQPGLPVAADLRGLDLVEVSGPEEPARALVRALLCAAAALHAPEDLRVAVITSDGRLEDWDWVKWLPHARSPDSTDAVGARRLVTSTPDELGPLLTAEGRSGRRLLLVDDRSDRTGATVLGDSSTTVVALSQHPPSSRRDDRTLRLVLDEVGRLRAEAPEAPDVTPDACDLVTATALARRLAPLGDHVGSDRPPTEGDASVPAGEGLMGQLGLGDVRRLDPADGWRTRSERDHLRVPIGVGDEGVVELDLKESALQGVGPHGLLVGATGSGKSELLRTLVLGLALTHAPDRLGMVLVDFKGGATFAGLAELPHVSALITNLADDLALVERMVDALSGELVRRQELLREAGGFASVHDYERARSSGADLEPLSSLLVVIDEFSELVAARPEVIDLLVTIGRLGRSLGLHLLVASQRLEEGRLRGLESHLSYRIALRTFSAQESRAVLGVPDAHALPPRPGLGLLRTDPTTLVPFTATYVSGPPPSRPRHAGRGRDTCTEIRPWTIAEVPRGDDQPPPAAPRHAGHGHQQTLLSATVSRLRLAGPRARRIWLPPLGVPSTLDQLLPDLALDARLGLVSPRARIPGRRLVPVGVVDRPRDQRCDPLLVDLTAAGGHLAVVGAPGSGKSTLLRTLVCGLALTTTPLETQVYVLDLGGGGCETLRGLPHVSGVATRSEPDVLRRIVAEVKEVLARREQRFTGHGLDSIGAYRRRRHEDGPAGPVDDGYGDVVVVVDGWGLLCREHDDLEPELQSLAARGSAYGVHLVAAAGRWADLRPAVRDLFGTRLELRLGDPVESDLDRRLASAVPADRPGRGLAPDGTHLLVALPRIDGDPDPTTLADGVAELVTRVSAAWPGPVGPRLRLLPERVLLDDVRAWSTAPADRLLIGVDETQLGPTSLDPVSEPHALVFGDVGSGKTATLRTYLHEVLRVHDPRRAQLVVVDYRRSLLGEVPDDHLLHYLTSPAQAAPALAGLASHLQQRLPGPDVTPAQLRARSWWSGAEAFVVVDDYDLVTAAHSSPLQVLVPLLGQARDIGLHLVLARRTGGAARAMYEPLIQALRELSAPGLVLSGNSEEGALLGGVRPEAAPPGRGRLVTRERGVEVVQVAWQEPAT